MMKSVRYKSRQIKKAIIPFIIKLKDFLCYLVGSRTAASSCLPSIISRKMLTRTRGKYNPHLVVHSTSTSRKAFFFTIILPPLLLLTVATTLATATGSSFPSSSSSWSSAKSNFNYGNSAIHSPQSPPTTNRSSAYSQQQQKQQQLRKQQEQLRRRHHSKNARQPTSTVPTFSIASYYQQQQRQQQTQLLHQSQQPPQQQQPQHQNLGPARRPNQPTQRSVSQQSPPPSSQKEPKSTKHHSKSRSMNKQASAAIIAKSTPAAEHSSRHSSNSHQQPSNPNDYYYYRHNNGSNGNGHHHTNGNGHNNGGLQHPSQHQVPRLGTDSRHNNSISSSSAYYSYTTTAPQHVQPHHQSRGGRRCDVPSDFWCDSDELAERCNVVAQCEQLRRDRQPLKVTIMFEALCPFCQRFIANQLGNLYSLFRDKIQLELVPWGNAILLRDGRFSCNHGQKECDANRLMSCVLDEVKSTEQAISFIVCLERQLQLQQSVDHAFHHCAGFIRTQFSRIKQCYTGERGLLLQRQAAHKTAGARANPIVEVPYILINDYAPNVDGNAVDILALPHLLKKWLNARER